MEVEVMYYKWISQATGFKPGIFLLDCSLLSFRVCHPSMQVNAHILVVFLGDPMGLFQAVSPGTLLEEMKDQEWGISQLFAVRFFPAPLVWDVAKAGNCPWQQRLQRLDEKQSKCFQCWGDLCIWIMNKLSCPHYVPRMLALILISGWIDETTTKFKRHY